MSIQLLSIATPNPFASKKCSGSSKMAVEIRQPSGIDFNFMDPDISSTVEYYNNVFAPKQINLGYFQEWGGRVWISEE